ncbi:hypothetical protein CL634_02555 [bacterium]|nr:hypothetical protein [bacterium]
MIIYIDIDETICYYKGERSYEKAIPIHKNIRIANDLYDQGNTIVYWTARGAVTGIDHTDLTKQQFKDWGVKYHELRLDKPYYDLFIDDRTLNSFDEKGRTRWDIKH